MSRRFGRNRRRQAREKIAALEGERDILAAQVRLTQQRLVTAREDGAAHVLRLKYLNEAVHEISARLASQYGPQIAGAAQKLLESDSKRPAPFDFRVSMDVPGDMAFNVTSIEGFIPSLHYRVQLANW